MKNKSQYILAARELRNNQTPAEVILWKAVRGRQLSGVKLKRQHVIEPFIADFYCAEARLIVEIDGDIHDYQKGNDDIRTRQLEDYGYRVVRFKNEIVVNELDYVLEQIILVVNQRKNDLRPDRTALTPGPSPIAGRGELDPLPLIPGKGAGG